AAATLRADLLAAALRAGLLAAALLAATLRAALLATVRLAAVLALAAAALLAPLLALLAAGDFGWGIDAPRYGQTDRSGARLPQQQLEQRFLCVPAVLGLIPDALPCSIQHICSDLLPGMCGKVVQCDRVRRRAVEQRVVDAVGRERRAALVGGVLVAHADPHVGVDGVRTGDRLV